jgi:glycosyltransferase involved in cell wall biosynthesis
MMEGGHWPPRLGCGGQWPPYIQSVDADRTFATSAGRGTIRRRPVPSVAAVQPPPPRHRRSAPAPAERVRLDGKFFRLGSAKFTVCGVTYGPFEPGDDGVPLPPPSQVVADLRQLADLHANVVRVYNTPPRWFLDLAQLHGVKVLLDVAWPKNISFDRDPAITAAAHAAVRSAAAACGNHPALFAISLVNEFPAELVRYVGRRKVERLLDELARTVRAEAPDCLVTFANYPTTEYLSPREVDFHCFNVYLHDERTFRNYLARLQNVVGGSGKPLILGEYGIDTYREQTEAGQAEVLGRHVRAVFDEGLAGTVVFSFTDDWFTKGVRIADWHFGLTRHDRSPKPAFAAVAEGFAIAPRTVDAEWGLPRVSVVVCSYNGAATVEACLLSLQRLRYADYEVVFVDDGSTDATPAIVARFPAVRYVRQPNRGLSVARNTGLSLATGDVVAYTDSDCEADEDWLYHLATALRRSTFVGVGGPNLIPDEGSWVADCVGLSPGGPTHVMLDDRTAEHVPGCNMAFWTWAARSVNGFDGQFRRAGDDVDFIWRLQNDGHAIGFAPAAQVWHYRRNTVAAYLRQQRGYGEAEALLKYKHPDRFNVLGSSHWRGRMYGGDADPGVRLGGDTVYHGVFGTGLFQSIYRRRASVVAAMLMSIEWHLLAAFVAVLGLAVPPLLGVAALMFVTPAVLAIVAAAQSPLPRRRTWLTRPLIAYLHFRQPIARGWARYSVRLRHKVLGPELGGDVAPRPGPLPFDPADRDALRYWSTVHDRFHLLGELLAAMAGHGWRTRVDSGWGAWDAEVYGSRYVKVRITTATEFHESDGDCGRLTRVRVIAKMSTFCRCLTVASLLLCVLLLARVWPYSRPAVLLPAAAWAQFLVARRRVMVPVLRLIDEVATKAGYWPVPSRGSA